MSNAFALWATVGMGWILYRRIRGQKLDEDDHNQFSKDKQAQTARSSRPRSLSFNSQVMLHSFPAAAKVPQPIINIAYFVDRCPSKRKLAKLFASRLQQYPRFNSKCNSIHPILRILIPCCAMPVSVCLQSELWTAYLVLLPFESLANPPHSLPPLAPLCLPPAPSPV
jgi:hypothetical protein